MTGAPGTAVAAAVLVPVYRDDDGELHLVLVRRAEGGPHGGQIAFPGGKREPEDDSMRATALRETEEEIGLVPGDVEVLAALEPVATRSTGFVIHPFLARIRPPPRWAPRPGEIAEVIDVAARELVRPERHGESLEHFPQWPRPRRIVYYLVGPHRLWGATYRIVNPLLPRLLAGDFAL